MNDEHIDAYLWDPELEPAPEVAAVERLVAPCRFEALPLALTPIEPGAGTASAWGWGVGLAVAVVGATLLWFAWPEPVAESESGVQPPDQEQQPPAAQPEIEPDPEPEPKPELEPELELEPKPEPPTESLAPRPRKESTRERPSAEPPDDAAAAHEPLPEKLGPSDILDGVRQVKGAIAACARKHEIAPGTSCAIKFQVAGSTGDVDFATVLPSHAGVDPQHPAVPCIQTEARAARFRRFSAERQSFTYKFKL